MNVDIENGTNDRIESAMPSKIVMLVPGCYTCALTYTGMNVGTHSTCCFSKYECVSFNSDSETQFR